MFGEPHCVGRERQFVEAVSDQRAEPYRKRVDPPPHERFATGQADAANTARDKTFGQFGHFLDAEHCRLGQKLHVLGHAISAAQVASVGHGQAQVIDPAAMSVDQRRRWNGGLGKCDSHTRLVMQKASVWQAKPARGMR
jgi:hypothetical protein